MGFVLGKQENTKSTKTNKKFILGSTSPKKEEPRVTDKNKKTLQESRLEPKTTEQPIPYEMYSNLEKAKITTSSNILAKQQNLPVGKKESPAPSKEYLKSFPSQVAAGISELTIPRTIMAMQKLKTGEEQPLETLVKQQAPYANAAKGGATLTGGLLENALMYGTVGKAVSGAKGLSQIANPFIRNLVGQQLADTAIQTPQVVLSGIANKKPVGEVLGDIGKQQGRDFVANLAFGTAEAALGKLGKNKAAKAPEIAKTAGDIQPTKQVGGAVEKAYKYSIDTLPDDLNTLETFVKQMEADQEQGIKVNLQLFAKAKEKLRIFTEIARGSLPEGEIERGFSKNIRTDKSMPDQIRELYDENPLGYKQLSNEETLAKAKTIMAQDDPVTRLNEMLAGNKYSPEAVPLAKMIAKDAQLKGDVKTARQVLSDVAVKLTESGQFSQSAKILRESDPETFLITVQKQLNNLNKQGEKIYKNKWKTAELLDDEILQIGKIQPGDTTAFENMMGNIQERLAKGVPSDAWEKFDAWRRTAMLLNPTTHIRNIVGNVVMGGMQKTSDTIAAGFERIFVPQAQRTKSVLWRDSADRVKTVTEAWANNQTDILKNGRWDIEGKGLGTLKALNNTKPIFKKAAPEFLNKASKDLLNIEDNIFVKSMWENSLGSFMKARGISEVTDEAVEYATRRAYEATFKQANLLSTTISKLKGVPVLGRLVEGAIPFAKTPSNIAMRAFEYSPASIMKILYDVGAKKGAPQIIEDLAKGMTGTGIAALGFTLAAAGWIRGKKYLSEKVEALKTKQGEQAYSLTTPFGSYTLEWAQPFSLPLFMGVAMYEELQNPKYDGKLLDAVLNSVYKGGDVLFEMSMLQNIKRLFGYGSTTQKIGGVALSYIEQAIPTILGKIARSIDPTVRETYDPNPAKEEWNRLLSKFPGLSTTLPEKIDNFGEAIKNNGVFTQMLSPGYAKAKDERPFLKELERLYNIDKSTDVIPSVLSPEYSQDKVDYVLSAKEYEQYKKTYGQIIMRGLTNVKGLPALTNSPEYKRLSDAQKISQIQSLYKKALDEARKEVKKGRGLK